jgi:HAE1 family hydrophobic/amphiphilic exporter-1
MIELSIKRPLVIFVLFSIIALLGLVTFGLLNINLLPKLETNYVTVVTVYPGASASEVENSVTKKIEDALSTLENLEKIKSTSQEGLCVTSLELKSSANPNLAVEEAQRKINAILADLPTGVKAPTISKVAPDEMPILRISATANMYPTDFYKTVENQIQPRLAKLQGVGQITLVGGSKREIRINIDKEKLQSYNLSILQVLVAIQKANQDFPTGNVETSGKRYSVRLAAKYASMEEVKNTAVITGAGGSEIRLNDVAEVQDGIAEQDQLSRLNTVNSIGIEVKKQTDANTLEVARLVKAELKKLEEEYAGSGMKFEIGTDSSTFTMESVNSVVFDLMLAIVIVSFVCLIFLHSIRSAIAVMVAVPLSMLPSFILL